MGLGIISKRNDTFTAFRYKVVAVNATARRFYVYGDQTQAIKTGGSIRIGGSVSNNGTYTVASTAFDTSANRTRVSVNETIADSVVDGILDLTDRTIPWQTGDLVVLNTTKFLPSPLEANKAYFVIAKSNTRFSLAETLNNAMTGVAIAFVTPGDGFLTVAQVESTFRVFGGASSSPDVWYHYMVDKTDIRTLMPPQTLLGMQSLVNIIDGYAAFQNDSGLTQDNSESNDFDPDTGRLVNWQFETERFIDWAFTYRNSSMVIGDTYQVVVSPVTDVFTFASAVPMWLNGTAVTLSSTGVLPDPLVSGTKYFVILTGTTGQIKLSTSPNPLDLDSIVDITSSGSGTMSIGVYNKQRSFPRFELNPARNNVWIDTPQGVLSNVITGPYSDIKIQQAIFDQYNRPITSENLTVYREDKRSHIAMRPEVANDVDPIYANDPYNYIHFGGAHLFLEGYEHFLLLNNYTVSGALIYDPFLGLSTTKFNVDYYEKTDYTLRPTLGGYYLVDNQFNRNMEGAASDLQDLYDILALSEATDMAKHSRALIGYNGRMSFLDMLNVNSKSQLMFYRGMIQSKGSINSVTAYVNSRRFVDAKLDEFWAWKLADFGDARLKQYPELNLFVNDGKGDLRLEFIGPTESTSGTTDLDAEFTESKAKGFNITSFKNTDRWYQAPQQKQQLTSPLFLDADVSSMTSIYCASTPPDVLHTNSFDFWFNTTSKMLYSLNQAEKTWTTDQSARIVVDGQKLYFLMNELSDDVRVIQRVIVGSNLDDYTNRVLNSSTDFARINSSVISFPLSTLTGVIILFAINPASSKLGPARLTDKASATVIENVLMWHPARGDHYPYAVSTIKFDKPTDPANYTTTLSRSPDNLRLNAWNSNEVGNVWWDKSTIGYTSYHDTSVYPNINDRVRLWGSLAPWASVDVYQWVESTVSPAVWDKLVASEVSDSTVPQSQKATGTAKKTVFKRSRTPFPFTAPDGRVVVAAGLVNEGDIILFTSTGTLPTGIDTATTYVVTNLSSDTTTFDLVDYELDIDVVISDAGNGSPMFVVPQFDPQSWEKQTQLSVRTYAPFVAQNSNSINDLSGPIVFPFNLAPTNTVAWVADVSSWSTTTTSTQPDVVNVYVNDVLIESNLVVNSSGSTLFVELTNPLTLSEYDVIDIVRPVHVVTATEAAFDPDLFDDGTLNIQWKEDYEYTITTTTVPTTYGTGTSLILYYFWVKDTTNQDATVHGSLSVGQAAAYLTKTPSAYFIVQKPKDDPSMLGQYQTHDFAIQSYAQMPIFYRQLIVQNILHYVDDDKRYTLQFTRDFTLRNDLSEYRRSMNVKEKHEQWMLFRKEQTSSIDYQLWNKLTESLVGYHVDGLGNKIRVPSLERELYDATTNSSTRIGLGVDQTFVDRTLGLSTVLSYLQDPTNDFSPANIEEFFVQHTFDTPENIRDAMDTIYTTFSAQHVNHIWFEALNDSMSLNAKYSGLMKTSWIALHGVQVLEVGGLFDD